MNGWWLARSPRERLLLMAGAALIGLLVLSQLVIGPLIDWRDDARARVGAAEREFNIVYDAAAAPVRSPAAGAQSSIPIRNALNQSAQRFGVPLTFVNAQPDGSVQVQAGPVEPERVFQLFDHLQSQFGIRASTADMARASGEPAMIRLQATLVR